MAVKGKINSYRYFVALLVLVTISCEKAELRGNGGLVAKVDGKVWRPGSNDLFKGHAIRCWLSEKGTRFFIDASNDEGGELIINLKDSAGILQNTYSFHGDPNFRASYYKDGQYDEHTTVNGYTGSIAIRIDKATYKAIGSFSFNAINPKTGSTVKVREGQFDVNYGPLP